VHFEERYFSSLLGAEWGSREVVRLDHQQHPIAYWYNLHADKTQNLLPDENKLSRTAYGASHAWLRLAYDIYLIKHNGELKAKLLKRLRLQKSFQGARFEIAVAAIMLAAGYELSFASEKGPGKHPEFLAKHKISGHIVSVEAKSRHRPGILGFPGLIDVSCLDKFAINKLLMDAVNKDTKEPLLIFIETNNPYYPENIPLSSNFEELSESWSAVQNKAWPKGFPSVGVIFYNDVAPWMLTNELPKTINSILLAAMQRSKIPTYFQE
jgi:hypothetical protein